MLQGAGLKGVEVCANGVSPINILDKVPANKLVLGYLAGAAQYKGYHLMRAAVTKGAFENLRLVVVDHSLKQNQVVREKWGTSEVERIGFVPQEQIAALYARLNVVLVPSIWPESFGLVAREGLKSGSWLVASNRGAAAEDVIEGQNGHVFDPGIPGDFSRVLALLNDNTDRYKAMPVATPIRSTTQQAEELLVMYESLARR